LNDPYHGGNHLRDLTVFVPVFVGGAPRFWSINRAHQSDIGGATHGAYNADATDIWQEGIRIPPLRLSDAGKLRQDALATIAANVRHPRDLRGDLAAMIGSAHVGGRRLLALGAEFGWPLAPCCYRGGARRRRAPHPRGHRRTARRHLSMAKHCSMTTAAATTTSRSAPPSKSGAAIY
jgi:hypothetical protein